MIIFWQPHPPSRWSIIGNSLAGRWSLFWPTLSSDDRSCEIVFSDDRSSDRHFLPMIWTFLHFYLKAVWRLQFRTWNLLTLPRWGWQTDRLRLKDWQTDRSHNDGGIRRAFGQNNAVMHLLGVCWSSVWSVFAASYS